MTKIERTNPKESRHQGLRLCVFVTNLFLDIHDHFVHDVAISSFRVAIVFVVKHITGESCHRLHVSAEYRKNE